MSGRTFGIQSSWDDVFKLLLPGNRNQDDRRRAVSVADSMNQQIEEFLNRYVVTSTNDDGDLIFDAAGSYTFNGPIIVNGASDFNGAMTIDGDVTVSSDITTSGSLITVGSGGDHIEIDGGASGTTAISHPASTTPPPQPPGPLF